MANRYGMKSVRLLVLLTVILRTFPGAAQSTTIPLGSQDYQTLDRLEIISGKLPVQFTGSVKPISRKAAVAYALQMDSLAKGQSRAGDSANPRPSIPWSATDLYDIRRLIANSGEWAQNGDGFTPSRKPLFKTLFNNTTNLLLVNDRDFFLSVNPVLLLQEGKEEDNSENMFINTRGIELRGVISHKVGFYSMLSDNQERDPQFVQTIISKTGALPGQGYFRPYGTTGVDYFHSEGYFSFTAAKYIDIEFGYGKNILGDGYRSLFLSDYSSPYLYLKLHTHIWKLDYENIFGQVISQFQNNGQDYLRPEKYIAIHQLNYDPVHWLEVGVFEAISFSRANYFDFAYLNPIIFYKSVEEALGSSDKAHVGLNFKADFAHHFQLYSQFLLDEFKLNEFFSSSGWWGNKWGLQLGGKYINALGIRNLDLQGELNVVRPYTYAHYDTVSNYTNYNQPLAHPLGANFWELLGIARYQYKRLYITGKVIYYDQGRDSLDGNSNFGGNIFTSYLNNIPSLYGNYIGQGLTAKVVNTSLLVSYELRDNLFLDLDMMMRLEGGAYYANSNSILTRFVSLGLHWNIARREYDY
jgi:hypothetical protein